MSTVETQNFKDLATSKSIDAAYVTDGTAKAWALVEASSLTDSLNVSSFTDVGTGNYELNLTNNMANNSYAGAASGFPNTAQVRTAQFGQGTASRIDLTSWFGNTVSDVTVSGMIMGDLA